MRTWDLDCFPWNLCLYIRLLQYLSNICYLTYRHHYRVSIATSSSPVTRYGFPLTRSTQIHLDTYLMNHSWTDGDSSSWSELMETNFGDVQTNLLTLSRRIYFRYCPFNSLLRVKCAHECIRWVIACKQVSGIFVSRVRHYNSFIFSA